MQALEPQAFGAVRFRNRADVLNSKSKRHECTGDDLLIVACERPGAVWRFLP